MRTHTQATPRSIVIALTAGLCASCSNAQQLETSWTAALNNIWNAPGNWSNGIPDNTLGAFTYSATIGPAAMSSPVLDSNPVVDRVLIDTAAMLGIQNGRVLGIAASPLPMDAPGGAGILKVRGTLLMNGTSGFTGIRAVGTGSVEIGDAALPGLITTVDDNVNRITGDTSTGQTVVLMDGLTFRGAGNIGDSSVSVDNRGTIIADKTNRILIRPGDEGMLWNSGLIRAENGAEVEIDDAVIDNTGGLFQAAGSSVVQFAGLCSVLNGTFDCVDDGLIDVSANLTLDGVFVNQSVNMNQNNGRRVTIRNGITLNGQWNMVATSSAARIEADGTQTISGIGTILTVDDTVNSVTCTNNTDELTLAPSITFRGSGELINGVGTIVNQGSIFAEGSNVLVIDPGPDAPSRFVNLGAVEALGPGGLRFDAGLFVNTGRTIAVGPGSQLLVQSGAVIEGGTLESDPGGGVTLRTCTLDGVTLAAGSPVDSPNAQRVTVLGSITNNTTWNVNGTSAAAGPFVEDGVTLSGNGEIVLLDDTVNKIDPLTPGGSFINGADHTIRGAGELLNGLGGMTNNGSIIADGSVQLIIDPGSGREFVNAGELIAQGSGGLRFDSGVFINTGRTIEVMAGSRLDARTGSEIIGGAIDVEPTGVFEPFSASTLDAVTITQDSTTNHPNGRIVTVRNGLTHDGTWNMIGTGSATRISFEGDQTLGGSGTIVTINDNVNQIQATGVVTHGPDHTFRGSGAILTNSGGFVNQGAVYATGSFELDVNPGASFMFVNTGTLGGDGEFDFVEPFINDGTIAPGLPENPVGVLTMDGDVSNSADASLSIQALNELEADRLTVDGTYAIDGDLVVSFTGGFEPEGVGPYEVLSATSLSGRFANAPSPIGGVVTGVVTGNARFDVVYDDAGDRVLIDNLELVIPACSPADLDSTGSLNFADVTAFLTLYGQGSLTVDFDSSGSLNFGDVAAFLTIYGMGCP